MSWTFFYKIIVVSIKRNPLPYSWKVKETRISKDQSTIDFMENGAGSKKLQHKRKVSQIYSKSRTRNPFGKIMAHLVAKNKVGTILELGTSLGIGTRYLALHAKQVDTVEGCPNTYLYAKKHFDELGLSNVKVHQQLFDNFLDLPGSWDMVYIDGNHQGAALIKYVRLLLKRNPNCIFLCDDIRWSNDMKTSFKLLKKEFKFSMNLYQMGVLSNTLIRF